MMLPVSSSLWSTGFNSILSGSTHEDGHTLDLVISHADAALVTDVQVEDPGISDRSAVSFNLVAKDLPLPGK